MKNQIKIQHYVCEMPQDSSREDIGKNEDLNRYLNAELKRMLGISIEELPDEIKQSLYESCLRGAYNGIFSAEKMRDMLGMSMERMEIDLL